MRSRSRTEGRLVGRNKAYDKGQVQQVGAKPNDDPGGTGGTNQTKSSLITLAEGLVLKKQHKRKPANHLIGWKRAFSRLYHGPVVMEQDAIRVGR